MKNGCMNKQSLGRWLALFAALQVGLGCTSDGDDAQDADHGAGASGAGTSGAGDADAGAGHAGSAAGAGSSDTALHGYFNLKLTPEMVATAFREAMPARTNFVGSIADGEDPMVLLRMNSGTLAAEAGDCRLMTPDPPFCDPDCGGTALCVEDGVCAEDPTPIDVGTVTVSGLGPDFELEPIAHNYQPRSSLPYPPCEEGDDIVIAADGGDFEPFTLTTKCIAPMEFPGPVSLESGQPLQLEWTPAAQPDLSRVQVELDIAHHGGERGQIECDVPDTGSLEIPASLVDQLLDLGVAGFPSIILTRVAIATGSTEQSQAVELKVFSPFENLVAIAGLNSCTSDEHCDAGQTCQSDFRCGP
jgi:hypothetical protein